MNKTENRKHVNWLFYSEVSPSEELVHKAILKRSETLLEKYLGPEEKRRNAHVIFLHWHPLTLLPRELEEPMVQSTLMFADVEAG